jgi:hypothetical protein
VRDTFLNTPAVHFLLFRNPPEEGRSYTLRNLEFIPSESTQYPTSVTPFPILSAFLFEHVVVVVVWSPEIGSTAACRLIVHTPCVFNVPTLTARRLHVTTTLEILAAKGVTCWARNFPGIFYMPKIYGMGPTALLPLRRKSCCGFFRPEKSDGFGLV